MARPDIELSQGLREWVEDRQLEVDLSQSITTRNSEIKAEQFKNRHNALKDFAQGITTKHYLYFDFIETYLRTSPEDRTPEDTENYKFKLDTLIQKFGDRFIPFMRGEWERRSQAPSKE